MLNDVLISVLSTIAWVFERLVYCQLSYVKEQHKYLPQYQSGLRQFHSAVTAVLKNSMIGHLIWVKDFIKG